MHELRKDPLLNKWIAVLKHSQGPDFYLEKCAEHPTRDAEEEGACVLCAGRENEAGREIFAIRRENTSQADAPRWHTRVIPRTDPLFQIEGDLGRRGVGMYDRMNSIGANEIIIESPRHDIPAEDMGLAQMSRVIETYRHRLVELEKDPRLRYTHLCKDRGRAAGGTYGHPYSQIIATPVIPKGIKDELDGAKAYYFYKERCIFCDIADEELRTGKRVIMDTSYFVAFTPFAPRLPFEFWILPKRHSCAFQDIQHEEAEDLGFVLMSSLKKMKRVLHDPPYSYVLHTAPNRVPRKDHWHTLGDDFHWHIEVMPQLQRKGGFELSSELYIIPTSPEDAADYLKGATPL